MFDYVKKVFTSFIGRKNTEINREPRVIQAKEHGINPKQVSFAARKTCENLQARGFKAYIVGGAVRDLLLGVTPKDFDVATDATPEQVKRAQRRAYIIGRRFRLVHVVFGQEIIECSTFRALDAAGQRKDASGRVISDNVFGQMWEDAARRDFTVNALYYDPSTGEVLDYHNGFEDLKRKRLTMIGDPQERYREDPVRMMRAVRIATKLGFTIDSATERAIPQMAKNLENVPAARLFDEMMKLFTCGHAEACLMKLRQEGLHRSLLPMLDVILKEKEGEDFLMLALRRTDERISSGKKISPAFLFATLLWPQVLKRWQAYQTRPKMIRSKALYAAADDVVATQCAKLAIQNRFVADMKLIWMLQLRFERRTGKNPYALIEHVKYRAGYDFMLLRSLLGQVPAEQVRWWDDFVNADSGQRATMIARQEELARNTADKARAGNARRQEERFVADTLERLTQEQMPARLRRSQQNVKRRGDGQNKSNLPIEDKTLLPIPIELETDVPPTPTSSVSRFDDSVAPALGAKTFQNTQEDAQPVKTTKSTKPRRTKKTLEEKREEPQEVLIQIETDPAYMTTDLKSDAKDTDRQPVKARRKKVSETQTSEADVQTVETVKKTVKKVTKKRAVKTEARQEDSQLLKEPKSTQNVTDPIPAAGEAKPKKRVTRKKKSDQPSETLPAEVPEKTVSETMPEADAVKVKRTRQSAKDKVSQAVQAEQLSEVASKKSDQSEEARAQAKPKRRTRTVKKTEDVATSASVDQKGVSAKKRRAPVRKKSALTHTAAQNDD